MVNVATSGEAGSSVERHEVWLHEFSPEDRQEQLHEDAVAWRNVTGLLFGVVAIGLVIAILAVWISGRL